MQDVPTICRSPLCWWDCSLNHPFLSRPDRITSCRPDQGTSNRVGITTASFRMLERPILPRMKNLHFLLSPSRALGRAFLRRNTYFDDWNRYGRG